MGGVSFFLKGKTPKEVERQIQARIKESKALGLYVDIKTNVVEIPRSFGEPDLKETGIVPTCDCIPNR